MKHLPTVKQLRYFVALEERKHFGKAAQACFVTQSAFSVAIQELESLLKVSLVDRTNRSVTITSIGTQIAGQARLALFDIEGIVDYANSLQEPLSGPLKIGVIPTIAPFILPKVLPLLRKQFPKLDLYLKEDQTTRIHAALMDGELDLLLLALPFELSNVDTMSLFKDYFKLAYQKNTTKIVPQNYKPSKLDSENVILMEDGHCLREHTLSACKIRKQDQVNKFSANSLYTLVQMVDNDLGITFLPEIALHCGLLNNTNVVVEDLSDRSYRTIGLAWRKSSVRKDEFKLLGDAIKSIM